MFCIKRYVTILVLLDIFFLCSKPGCNWGFRNVTISENENQRRDFNMERRRQYDSIERILQTVKEKLKGEETLKAIAKKRRQIERKLYQKPPLLME